MPRDKIIQRKPSAVIRYATASQEYDPTATNNQFTAQLNSPPTQKTHTSMNETGGRRIIHKSQKSQPNFRDFVLQSLQKNKDHIKQSAPKEIMPQMPESTYQEHYIKKQVSNFPKPKSYFFEQPKHEGIIEMISTTKHDFRGEPTVRATIFQQPRPQSSSSAFQGRSVYATTFVNWKIGDKTDIIPNNHPTVIKDMPFMGNSIYKDSFRGIISPPPNSIKIKQGRSPLNPPNMPFEKESIAMTSYKPFKVQYNPHNFYSSQILKSPSFVGQYKTNYQKDFTDKLKEEMEMDDLND